MKYQIPQDRLDNIVFRYLDMQYGDLEKIKNDYYDFIFKKPDSDAKYGIMSYDNTGDLYISYGLTDEISAMFSLEDFDSRGIIGRWVKNKFNLKVTNPDSRA